MGVLQGKVAVITGAGAGLGREYALLFAKEGAKIVVNDPGCNRDGTGAGQVADEVVREIQAAGGEAVANYLPVGSMANAAKIVQTAIDSFGKIDILVNNAGILRDRTILNMTEAEWDDVVNVHLKGTFSCLQAAAVAMKEQGKGGRIINTSSSSGLLGNFGQSNYGAAKAGIYGLTRVAAQEFMKLGITVNAIAPIAATRMLADLPEFKGLDDLDKLGPRYVAPLVAFLATDASAQITGQTFGIEGNQLFLYRMTTTHGVTRYQGPEPFTIEEVGKAMHQVLFW
jgi:NAD(P)-dependent dehydrogenase (short-subunit alcohol dehydrogenase family)